MIRDKHRKSWIRLHRQYERKAQRLLLRYFRQQAMKVPYRLLNAENYIATINNSIKIGGLYDVYFQMYKVIGLLHGERIGKQINRDIKEFSTIQFQGEFQRGLYQWVIENVGHRIVSVREQYKQHITKLVAEGFRQGWTPQQLSANIHRLVNQRGFYRWQSLRIARTEASAGANRSAVMAGHSAGVVWDKEWISIPDNRVRTLEHGMFDHRAMDGVRVPKEGFFNINGEELEHPSALTTRTGQRSSAGNVINCRCTVAVVVRRDANGRAIRTGTTTPIPRMRQPLRPILPKPQTVTAVPKGFIPAKTTMEATKRFQKFAPKVHFQGLPLDKQNEILHGIEDVLGKYNVTLKNDIGFQIRRRRSLGIAGYRWRNDGKRDALYIRLQKTYSRNAQKLGKQHSETFIRNKESRLRRFQDIMNRTDLNEGRKAYYQEKMDLLKQTPRWTIEGDRHLYSTTVHEAFHSVDYFYGAEKVFREQLIKNGINKNDWYKVSEYGASKMAELWAEVGTAIQTNTQIPSGFVKAFNDTLKIIGAI